MRHYPSVVRHMMLNGRQECYPLLSQQLGLIDSSLTRTDPSVIFTFFSLSFLGPIFSFLLPMCVPPMFCLAQSTIDDEPVIHLNVSVSSSYVTILFEIEVSLSVSSSSSNGSVFERPTNKIREVRHNYAMNVGKKRMYLQGMSYHFPSNPVSDLSRRRVKAPLVW
jgi:hypothetical protein